MGCLVGFLIKLCELPDLEEFYNNSSSMLYGNSFVKALLKEGACSSCFEFFGNLVRCVSK